ncbi:MAG: maltose alpha-D-glucosyltransferase [Proteobacteria bacterium]|nr:maltose alpha-D-glucosyltransferase [Desulfobulbaceae bacterium]MBU4153260.1 maltose alpha-D-glucosyltransferase [Pseudomonadota bacterium]
MHAKSQGDPLWYKDAIIYELHVKAFCDSSGDGIGDFPGLISKLDYIQDLGVNTIWLLPFYPSPFKDDGYDISDYRGVHPDYGTLRDFRQFVREAHRRGLRVITELVINHTSDQHPWFQTARRAKPGSAHHRYYVWSDTNTKFPDTRIIFTDSETSNWAWDPVAKAYYWHRFFTHQPDLNLNNPQVIKAVTRVLNFWLDMGVDGLRLDAVPYLCVREGTTNENLPETHAVIKEIRREMDLHYNDRVLLAEANQWPEDTAAYFGEGDECQMAFHFPLMPRIYMALRQEDRRPITEILERTPEIPANCQWGIFLRNHDELTLEMVTDEERDYMYREYAKDPRMRVNVGIRRRLAPLLDNSRRRMELLNSLLFSLPGTPIMYYGDEIGMGDNFFLGDRNGVRTPMQWSADRNAGFSKADPARLYLPVIMDPVYGYTAINIEAQERDPSSLLHFMKRMLALRRQHKAFGRGTLEFLRPENRKVLVYLRRYKREVILVVANLSRFVQPVELDLSEYKGYVPVEMIGRTEFPSIGELPYFVTIGPHSFYWFRLEPPAELIRFDGAREIASFYLPILSIAENWSGMLEGAFQHVLENEILPVWLPTQRWFRGKSRIITGVALSDWAKMGGSFFVAFITVSYSEGEKDDYCLPLKVVTGAAAERLVSEDSESVLAVFKTPRGKGVFLDGLVDRVACCELFEAMADSRSFSTVRGGKLQAFATRAFEKVISTEIPCGTVRLLGLEQSNSSVVMDEQSIFKLYRRLEEGANPDFAISLHLTEHTNFEALAPVAGGILLNRNGTTAAVAMLQPYLESDGEGWTYALHSAKDFLGKTQEIKEEDLRPFAGMSLLAAAAAYGKSGGCDGFGEGLTAFENLGRRTAEFHVALASTTRQSAFKPEALDEVYLQSLADVFSRHARQTLVLLNSRIRELPEDIQIKGDLALAEGDRLISQFHQLSTIKSRATRIRCHGDYHLGQVLRRGTDWILLDFEGEPLRTLGERQEKHSPMKDVAGMLRSFAYAAMNILFSRENAPPEEVAFLSGRLQAWEEWVRAAFLHGYLDRAVGASFLPTKEKHLELLLHSFILDKAFYETEYELNNRPDWLRIPLEGILTFMSGGKGISI